MALASPAEQKVDLQEAWSPEAAALLAACRRELAAAADLLQLEAAAENAALQDAGCCPAAAGDQAWAETAAAAEAQAAALQPGLKQVGQGLRQAACDGWRCADAGTGGAGGEHGSVQAEQPEQGPARLLPAPAALMPALEAGWKPWQAAAAAQSCAAGQEAELGQPAAAAAERRCDRLSEAGRKPAAALSEVSAPEQWQLQRPVPAGQAGVHSERPPTVVHQSAETHTVSRLSSLYSCSTSDLGQHATRLGAQAA